MSAAGHSDVLLLRSVRLADAQPRGTLDVEVSASNRTITRIGEALDASPATTVIELDGYVLLPAPVEPHAHLDKALLADRMTNPSGDLMGAIAAMEANRETLTVEDIADRAETAARMLVANGVTAVRTHADTTVRHGLRSVEGLVRTRERVGHLIDVQIVALVSWPITGAPGADHRALLRDALAAGADVVGGCPHLEDEPARANDVLLEIAADTGRPVDLHTDETLDPTILTVHDLAERVAKTGFSHGVTASHCVSLGVQPVDVQHAVAESVAEAGVSVITLPQTNLFLQGRNDPVATPRGLTALRPLLAAGVNVAGGADNLQDPFNLMGRADPLETAALLVMAGHLSPEEAYDAVSRAGRVALGLPPVAIEPGAPAELLAVRAASLRELLAAAPPDRLVVHGGRVVSRTRLVTDP